MFEVVGCKSYVPVKGNRLTRPRVPDGKVCLNEMGELAVTKFAVEPVRY